MNRILLILVSLGVASPCAAQNYWADIAGGVHQVMEARVTMHSGEWRECHVNRKGQTVCRPCRADRSVKWCGKPRIIPREPTAERLG